MSKQYINQKVIEEFRKRQRDWEIYGPLGMGIAYPKLEQWIDEQLEKKEEEVLEEFRKVVIPESYEWDAGKADWSEYKLKSQSKKNITR